MKRKGQSRKARALRTWRTVRAYWSWWYVVGAVVLALLTALANLLTRGPW